MSNNDLTVDQNLNPCYIQLLGYSALLFEALNLNLKAYSIIFWPSRLYEIIMALHHSVIDDPSINSFKADRSSLIIMEWVISSIKSANTCTLISGRRLYRMSNSLDSIDHLINLLNISSF